MLPVPFLAEFTPLSAPAQLAIFSLILVASLGTNIWFNVRASRRKPTIDVDLVKLASQIETLAAGFSRLSAAVERSANHASEIKTLQREVQDLRRARDEDQGRQRSYTQKTTRELFERMEAGERAMAKNFQSVERSLGRIEGQLTVKPA